MVISIDDTVIITIVDYRGRADEIYPAIKLDTIIFAIIIGVFAIHRLNGKLDFRLVAESIQRHCPGCFLAIWDAVTIGVGQERVAAIGKFKAVYQSIIIAVYPLFTDGQVGDESVGAVEPIGHLPIIR